jgi:hypothetical protein
MKLIDKARSARSFKLGHQEPTDEEVELAVEFFNLTLTTGQVAFAIDRKVDGGLWQKMAGILRAGIAHGKVKKIEIRS